MGYSFSGYWSDDLFLSPPTLSMYGSDMLEESLLGGNFSPDPMESDYFEGVDGSDIWGDVCSSDDKDLDTCNESSDTKDLYVHKVIGMISEITTPVPEQSVGDSDTIVPVNETPVPEQSVGDGDTIVPVNEIPVPELSVGDGDTIVSVNETLVMVMVTPLCL